MRDEPDIRLLIVTYHFPPDGAIGAVRPYQFARLLPDHGIETWVLTVQEDYAERLDVSFQPEGIPENRIVRTQVRPSRRDRYLQITAPLRAWIKRLSHSERTEDSSRQIAFSPPLAGKRTLLLWKCFTEWLSYPDWYHGWYRPALKAVDRLFERFRFSAVFSTSPPRTAALIAHQVARRYRVPWIMDLRDPWLDYDEGWSAVKCALLRHFYLSSFAQCLQLADAIVVNTKAYAINLRAKYPFCREKLCVLPNGVDSSVIISQTPCARPGKLVIAHFGTVYGTRTARPFLEGVARWLSTAPEARRSVETWFYGDTQSEDVADLAMRLGIAEMVRVHPAVPRQDVFQLMEQCAVLLLLAQKQPLQVPGKVYEYLAMGKPIIAMTERDGATGMLLQDAPGSYIVETPEDVAQVLNVLWQGWKDGETLWADRQEFLSVFRYPCLTQQLASIVSMVVTDREKICP